MRSEREIRGRLDKGCIHYACKLGPGYLCEEMRLLKWVLADDLVEDHVKAIEREE